jgi:hypothetical protein
VAELVQLRQLFGVGLRGVFGHRRGS